MHREKRMEGEREGRQEGGEREPAKERNRDTKKKRDCCPKP